MRPPRRWFENTTTIPEIHMSTLEQALALLRAIGIVEVVYSLEGCGDSGTADIDSVTYADGREATEIPNFAISFGDGGQVITLAGLVDDLVAELPDGDWVNNEGGSGTVILRPMEEDEDERVECDMTFRADGDYGDGVEFDDEEFLDEDQGCPNDEDPVVGPITIAAETIGFDPDSSAEENIP
jgi:hypothetical protein